MATKDNVNEIEEVYDFASQNGLQGVKVLTINDFGERIEQEDVSKELGILVEKMRDKGYFEAELYVHNNKRILKKRFVNNGCMLTIVDHMKEAILLHRGGHTAKHAKAVCIILSLRQSSPE